MLQQMVFNQELVQTLPLPLAQLYGRAHNAKTPLERNLAAYYLWEGALKLLASVALSEYAQQGSPDPKWEPRLDHLAAPSTGHWWELVRGLIPRLADAGDPPFQMLRDVLLGRARDDLPRAAGLYAALGQALQAKSHAGTNVRPSDLFERLLRYRTLQVAHGALGQGSDEFYDEMGRTILLGVAELLGKLDMLAGRRLVYVADVRRQKTGAWLVECHELVGETARRMESLEFEPSATGCLPKPERLYAMAVGSSASLPQAGLRSLHPLLIYEPDGSECFFWNGRQNDQEMNCLSYRSGPSLKADWEPDSAEPLERLLRERTAPMPRRQTPPDDGFQDSGAGAPVSRQERRTLGEFELLSRIGCGGMGVVYRAWQPSLGRQVAVKCLHHSGDAKCEARFAREIQALGRVEHPHLVKIFTSGVVGDQWFYAMELVQGADLHEVAAELGANAPASEISSTEWQDALGRARQRAQSREERLSAADGPAEVTLAAATAPLPETRARDEQVAAASLSLASESFIVQAVEAIRQVAEAAHALHEAGVVHRDIKPSNIMLLPGSGRAVLMDLGLAQLADDADGRLTRTRQFIGTLRYASPEQVLAVGRLDRRSDVYSLGATLWELLTLRPLFGAGSEMSTPELMLKVQSSEPDRVRRFNPRISSDLEAIVHKCLEKDCTRRYSTAADLAADLGRWQRGEPVMAQPPTLGYLLAKQVRRYRLPLALAAGVLCAALVGTVVAFVHVQRARRDAVAAWTEAEAARNTAEQAREQIRQQELRVRRRWYAARIQEAQRAFDRGEVFHIRPLLRQVAPKPASDEQDLRGFEWFYFWGLGRDRQFVPRRESSVTWIDCCSKNILAAAHANGIATLWEMETGRHVGDLVGHAGIVNHIRFSRDGSRLVTAGVDHTARVWSASTRQTLHVLRGHSLAVNIAVFSPDGKRIATASDDQTVGVWDTETGERTDTLMDQAGQVYDMAFSPTDANYLTTVGDDGTLRFWKLSDKTSVVKEPSENHTEIWSVSYSRDGLLLATGDEDGWVHLWSATPGQQRLLAAHRAHQRYIQAVAFAPDGKRLASASGDGTAIVWEVPSLTAVRTLTGHQGWLGGLAFSHDGRILATAGAADRMVILHHVDSESSDESEHLAAGDLHQGVQKLDHPAPVQCLAYTADGQLLASGCDDGNVRLFEARTGALRQCQKLHDAAVLRLDFSPGGGFLASLDEDGVFCVHRLDQPWTTVFREPETQAKSLAFSPQNDVLAVGLASGAVHLFDVRRASRLDAWDVDQGVGISALVFSRRSRMLAAGSERGIVVSWDLESRKERARWDSRTDRVDCLAWADQVSLLAMGGHDSSVWICDPRKPGQPTPLAGHLDSITGMAFSPDGRVLATVSYDQNIMLWDPSVCELRATLRGHTGTVHAVAFAPDGKTLATSSSDNTVRLWHAVTEDPLRVSSGPNTARVPH